MITILGMARILFMGTPQFAVPVLSALVEKVEIVAVVTQPDAPAGRGRALTRSPVKQFALAHGLPVLQPESLKPPEVVAQLRAYTPDAIVVAAFGQILRRDVLALPPRGCINVHASLLPRWRGASPISAAIAAGDSTTGITIMLMEAGLDSGPILSQRAEPIRPDDTTASLGERLSHTGAALLPETLPRWLNGQITPQRQDESQVTKCSPLKKDDGRIDWSRNAGEIERQVRAMTPWPSAWTVWQSKQLQVKRARISAMQPLVPSPAGTVIGDSAAVCVQCGEGILELLEVQLEGKRAMPASEFARGQRQLAGALLGK
ncbi:MAG: methionyl-tRNA formyltransferase [Chloroflexi bacterium]|nr:methionyl-tRNA formyltransferase [Chloroflexota bacterium]